MPGCPRDITRQPPGIVVQASRADGGPRPAWRRRTWKAVAMALSLFLTRAWGRQAQAHRLEPWTDGRPSALSSARC